MFALAKQAFPSGEGGSRRLTDEEIEVCTAEKTSVPSIIIKFKNFRLGENLPFKNFKKICEFFRKSETFLKKIGLIG